MAGSIQKYMNASLLQQNNKLLSDKQVIEGNPLFCIQKNPIIRYGFETITKNGNKNEEVEDDPSLVASHEEFLEFVCCCCGL